MLSPIIDDIKNIFHNNNTADFKIPERDTIIEYINNFKIESV